MLVIEDRKSAWDCEALANVFIDRVRFCAHLVEHVPVLLRVRVLQQLLESFTALFDVLDAVDYFRAAVN